MSNAAIFAQNATTQTLTSGSPVNLGTAVHGFGNTSCCQKIMDMVSGNLVLRECGMYGITMAFAVSASAAATVTLSVYENGVFTGVQMPTTISAANDAACVVLPIGPRVDKGTSDTISVVATSTAGDIIIGNVSTVGKKF